METGLDKAIKHFDGVGALAAKLGVYQSAVSNWRMRGQVPAERCRQIFDATGGVVELHELRPDLWEKPKDAFASTKKKAA